TDGQSTTGHVEFGTGPGDYSDVAYDTRGQFTRSETHYVQLSNLDPNTPYYFQVASGTSLNNNNGQGFTFMTAPTLDTFPPFPNVLRGSALVTCDPNGSGP